MPVIMRSGGYAVIMYAPPREHSPAHVHVRKAEEKCVVHLEPVAISRNTMSPTNARGAVSLVTEHLPFLQLQWRRMHGQEND